MKLWNLKDRYFTRRLFEEEAKHKAYELRKQAWLAVISDRILRDRPSASIEYFVYNEVDGQAIIDVIVHHHPSVESINISVDLHQDQLVSEYCVFAPMAPQGKMVRKILSPSAPLLVSPDECNNPWGLE